MMNTRWPRTFAVILAAAMLAACGDGSHPTSLRDITPALRGAHVVVASATDVIGYSLPHTAVTVSNAAIVSVSAGTKSENTATVPPGASIQLSGHWERFFPGVAGDCVTPCHSVAFLAWTSSGLSPIVGVADVFTFDRAQDNPTVHFDFAATATAPTNPGIYYIGVRLVDGSTPDNGIGITGVNTKTFQLDVASFRITVVAPPPVVTPTASGTLGNNGWYTSSVTVKWTTTDPYAAIDSKSGCDDATISTDGTTTLACTATSANGTTTNSITIKRDATPPTVSGLVFPNPVLLNETAVAKTSSSDAGGSLMAATSCEEPNTSAAGTFAVRCSAIDGAGNTTTIDLPYTVIAPYAFSGFLAPFSEKQNTAKAGSAIPINFSLGGDEGRSILAAGYPTSQAASCPAATSGTPIDAAPTASTSGSSLSYNAATDIYTIVWKTEKAWANSCRTLILKLADGTVHTALIQFTK